MKLQIERHLFYEIYPDVLADWLSHEPIEDQAIFLAHYIKSLNYDQMDKMSESFTKYSYVGNHTSTDLEEFAKRARDAMIVKFGGDYD